jgi:predicted RNase H-like nuclease
MADGALNTVFTKKNLIKYKQSFRRNQNTRKVSLLRRVEDVLALGKPSFRNLSAESINKVTTGCRCKLQN